MFKKALILGVAGVFLVSGCSEMSRNVGIGTAAGGVAGAAIGRTIGDYSGNKRGGTVIGAVVGAGLGAIIGQRMSQQTEELQQVPGVEHVSYDQEQQKIETRMQVLFDVDKSLIKPTERVKLDELANVFAKYPENIVLVEGHTDSDGTDAYNQGLSERRAAAIEAYLRSKNLNIASLSSVGYGESMPIASNATSEGKALNRRVEIKITVDPNRVPQQQQPAPGARY